MTPFLILLVLFALLGLGLLALLLRWERRHFSRQGKASAWLRLRLATIPIALLTAALVMLPARSVSGMEGLAVFYLLLLLAAPLFWFFCHWLVGRLMKLRFSDAFLIALTPLVLLLTLTGLAHTLQPLAWSLLHTLGL